MTYRYKAPHDGCTRFSVKGLKHINKLGKLISIEAYIIGTCSHFIGSNYHNYINNMIRIRVTGENGTCTYGGFLWGYGGEGPHGLRDLFIKCGMDKDTAEYYAFTGKLGPNDATEKNAKLYNATTLWKFMNSDIGWNRVITEKQVPKTGFNKGQEYMCSYSWGNPIKCKFVKMYKGSRDMALVKTDDCKSWCVPLRTLTAI